MAAAALGRARTRRPWVGRRLWRVLRELRHGFWFRPLALLAAGIGLGLALIELDEWLAPLGDLAAAQATSPEGARALLTVAAGALATTLAIALSMTMVTVQLASSQYTPRLLRRFLADRFTQHVLGAFLATIAYSFVLLRAIRSPAEGAAFVPTIAVSVAVALTLACLALLVVFLHRTMRSMQASNIVASIGRETIARVAEVDLGGLTAAPPQIVGPAAVVRATHAGYVQVVDDATACAVLARAGARVVRRDATPGGFVVPGMPMLTAYGVEALADDVADQVRACVTLGSERTDEDDLAYGVRQLVDMALKALSPGINDVTTAVIVVNELGAIARALVEQDHPRGRWLGHVAPERPLYLTEVLDLAGYLALAFDEIVLAAAGQPRVHLRILELLAAVRATASSAAAQAELDLAASRVRHALGPQPGVDRGVAVAERQRLLDGITSDVA
ncbi:MAG: DUF2254 domain-containing protein [Kofleriaceae bacterium]